MTNLTPAAQSYISLLHWPVEQVDALLELAWRIAQGHGKGIVCRNDVEAARERMGK